MKNYTKETSVIALIMLFSLVTSAQITISAENVPSAGTNFIVGIDDLPFGINPGTPGPGKLWDFTSLVPDETIGYAYQHPSATPFSSYFPGANLAMHSTDTVYSYLYSDMDSFELQGVVLQFESEQYVFDYTPDMIILDFPFAYGDQISQDYSFEYLQSYTGDTIKIKSVVTKTLEADAFGLVTIPAGTFEALRANITQVSKDTMWTQVFGNWMIISATLSTTNYYDWYTDDPNVDIRLVSLTYDESWTELESAEFFRDSFVGTGHEADKTGINIYPNPSSGRLCIETDGMTGRMLQIINITGEIVTEREITSDKEELGTLELSPGMYICRIVDENSKGIYQQKVMIR